MNAYTITGFGLTSALQGVAKSVRGPDCQEFFDWCAETGAYPKPYLDLMDFKVLFRTDDPISHLKDRLTHRVETENRRQAGHWSADEFRAKRLKRLLAAVEKFEARS